MTREETLEWAKSLKPGDKVIYERIGVVRALEVKSVTPSAMVEMTNNLWFSLAPYTDAFFPCGINVRGGCIVPATGELLYEAQRQDMERKKEEK